MKCLYSAIDWPSMMAQAKLPASTADKNSALNSIVAFELRHGNKKMPKNRTNAALMLFVILLLKAKVAVISRLCGQVRMPAVARRYRPPISRENWLRASNGWRL